MKAEGWGEGKGDIRGKEEAAGEIDGVGDFDRDGAGLRVKWGGMQTAGKAPEHLHEEGESLEVTRMQGAATAKYQGRETEPGTRMEVPRPGETKLGQKDQEKGRQPLGGRTLRGEPGDATGGPHVGGRGDARPGPLPPGSAAAAPTRSTGSSEAAEARALVTQPVAQPPPPPLPPAEATHASPLARPQQPQSRLETRSRETIGLYREIPAAARRMSREACRPRVGGAKREAHAL